MAASRRIMLSFRSVKRWVSMQMNKSARNERRKLTASFFNSVASGTVIAALVAPFIGLGLGTVQPSADIWNILGLSGFGLTLAFLVHAIARDLLKGMEE